MQPNYWTSSDEYCARAGAERDIETIDQLRDVRPDMPSVKTVLPGTDFSLIHTNSCKAGQTFAPDREEYTPFLRNLNADNTISFGVHSSGFAILAVNKHTRILDIHCRTGNKDLQLLSEIKMFTYRKGTAGGAILNMR